MKDKLSWEIPTLSRTAFLVDARHVRSSEPEFYGGKYLDMFGDCHAIGAPVLTANDDDAQSSALLQRRRR